MAQIAGEWSSADDARAFEEVEIEMRAQLAMPAASSAPADAGWGAPRSPWVLLLGVVLPLLPILLLLGVALARIVEAVVPAVPS